MDLHEFITIRWNESFMEHPPPQSTHFSIAKHRFHSTNANAYAIQMLVYILHYNLIATLDFRLDSSRLKFLSLKISEVNEKVLFYQNANDSGGSVLLPS